MKKATLKKALCIVLTLIMAFSCLTMLSFAAGVTVVKQPTKRSYYQGIDWTYTKSNSILLSGDLDLAGTVLSSGGKTVEYVAGKYSNMFYVVESGSLTVGDNTIQIYCDDFDGYATTTVKIIKATGITLVSPPVNTIYVKDLDWKMGKLGDVELPTLNITGLTVKASYSDGTTKTVSYPETATVGWAVSKNTDSIKPGEATIYATFCGYSVPFTAQFVTTNPHSLGDVSKDGKINSADALLVLQHSTEAITLDYSKARLADVNGDSKINSYDALKILQYSVGKIKSF